MFEGSGVTRSLTGSARVLGLMCLLCLISLDNCMESNFGDEFTVTAAQLKEARRMIQDAEDVKESKRLFGQTSVEMYAEWDRHADTLQDIIARGAPQMKKLQPIFQLMDNVNIEVRENLLSMIDENEQMAMKLDKAKELVAYLEKHQKPKKDEL